MSDQQPSGHRKSGIAALRAESLVKTFTGMPTTMPAYQAIEKVLEEARCVLKGTPFAVFQYLVGLNDKKIKSCPHDFNFYEHLTLFIAFPENEKIADAVNCSVRTVQNALKTLVEAGFVWMNDSPSMKRTPYNGICLLPGFARLEEIESNIFNRATEARLKKQIKAELRKAEVELLNLEVMPELRSTSTLDELKQLIERCRKKRSLDALTQDLSFVRQQIDELKAMLVLDLRNRSIGSSEGEKTDTPLTYKLTLQESQVLAYREEESSRAEDEIETPVTSEAPGNDIVVITPKPETAYKSLLKILHSKKLHVIDQGNTPADKMLVLYGNSAAGEIKLNEREKLSLINRFGRIAAAQILIQAAHDPQIRHRAAWAAHFVRKRPDDGRIDLSSSFYRMVKGYVQDAAIA